MTLTQLTPRSPIHGAAALLCFALLLTGGTAIPSNAIASDTDRKSSKKIPKKARYDYIRRNVEIEQDEHLGARIAMAPEIRFKPEERNKWTDGYVFYRLRAFDVGQQALGEEPFSGVQLRMRQTTLGDWQGYHSAFSRGKELQFRKIDSHVDCTSATTCYKNEEFAIDMNLDQLREMGKAESFSFKVFGSGKDVVVEVPSTYINGFIDALE